MATIIAQDGTQIYYKDWGEGRPVVFSHGWPLCSDAFEDQMFFLARNGYRCIAADRRGHGRSSQPWTGNDLDTYADDLSQLLETVDVTDAMLVGHSTGGGEVARYIGRHGMDRVSGIVLIGSITPTLLRTAVNPDGLPMQAFDQIRAGIAADRSQFFEEFPMAFYGYNRPGAKPSQGVIDSFWHQTMMGGLPNEYDCVKAFSETDLTDDLRRIEVPTLVLHGDDDQIVPVSNALKTAQLVTDARLKIYRDAPHGMCTTHKQQVNEDLLAFLHGEVQGTERPVMTA
jgi:non-heme chloroperoxidase